MLQMRARGFCGRDKFSDALKGLVIAEEAMDIPPDNLDVKKQREAATLDVSTLQPSIEQNRGHADTGLERSAPTIDMPSQEQTKQVEDVICNDCRRTNGHADDCPHKQAETKTSRPTNQVRMTINGKPVERSKTSDEIKAGKKTGKKVTKKWLEIPVLDEQGNEFTLYVWSASLAEHLESWVQGFMRGEVSDRTKDGSTYRTLEHILMINGRQFVNDEPAEVTGEMPQGIPAAELGFPEPEDQ
jgi:ribosome-binding protein aMBF1 (putative translation factor)